MKSQLSLFPRHTRDSRWIDFQFGVLKLWQPCIFLRRIRTSNTRYIVRFFYRSQKEGISDNMLRDIPLFTIFMSRVLARELPDVSKQ